MDEASRPTVPGYETVTHIGSGGSADVWLLQDPDGGRVAAKVFRSVDLSAGRREWRSLRRHAGPHVVAAMDYLRDNEGRSVLLMPYLDGGNLWDVVSGRHGLTCGEVVTALAPMAEALARVHGSGCVHGDVTPRNVLFDRAGKPWLADLGAIRATAAPGEAEWGSAGFVAPELLDGEAPEPSSDVYSLGAVAWFSLTAEPPQPPALRPHLRDVVPGISEDLAELITSCLAITPSARPEMAQIAPRLLAAERPVAVPLDMTRSAADTPETPRGAGDITRRLRDEAQKRQRSMPAARPALPPRRRGLPVTGRTPVLVGAAAAITVGAVTLWPQGSPASSKKSGQARASVTRPSVEAVSRQVGTPTAAQLTTLLDCRARAWNAGEAADLGECFVPDSQAMRDDTAALSRAQKDGQRYRNVSYKVFSVGRPVPKGPESWEVSVDVTRSAYEVTSSSGSRRMPPSTSAVTLLLTGMDDGLRISGWRAR